MVNSTANRIDVYDTAQRRFLSPIATDTLPVAGALSRNGKSLYVVCYSASTMDVIDLDSAAITKRVSVPAPPEGIAVGADDRALITTIGVAGAPNTRPANTMLLYNPDPAAASVLSTVTISLPAPGTPAATPSYNASRSHLVATPDGRLIIGLNNPTATTRSVFVFETASGSVLRSRTITNVSSVVSVSPDGSRFMAGLSLSIPRRSRSSPSRMRRIPLMRLPRTSTSIHKPIRAAVSFHRMVLFCIRLSISHLCRLPLPAPM